MATWSPGAKTGWVRPTFFVVPRRLSGVPLDLKKLQPPLEHQLALLGYELVHLESVREGKDEILRIYLDHLDAETSLRPITLDDCTRAHEGLLPWMDVAFPDLREHFGIEVSSPGMERPLTKADHFRRFAGRLCRLQTGTPVNGQKRFKGWIGPVEGLERMGLELILEEDGVLKRIPLEAIQKSRLAPFDESKTPRPKHLTARLTPAPHADGVETSAAEDQEA